MLVSTLILGVAAGTVLSVTFAATTVDYLMYSFYVSSGQAHHIYIYIYVYIYMYIFEGLRCTRRTRHVNTVEKTNKQTTISNIYIYIYINIHE